MNSNLPVRQFDLVGRTFLGFEKDFDVNVSGNPLPLDGKFVSIYAKVIGSPNEYAGQRGNYHLGEEFFQQEVQILFNGEQFQLYDNSKDKLSTRYLRKFIGTDSFLAMPQTVLRGRLVQFRNLPALEGFVCNSERGVYTGDETPIPKILGEMNLARVEDWIKPNNLNGYFLMTDSSGGELTREDVEERVRIHVEEKTPGMEYLEVLARLQETRGREQKEVVNNLSRGIPQYKWKLPPRELLLGQIQGRVLLENLK